MFRGKITLRFPSLLARSAGEIRGEPIGHGEPVNRIGILARNSRIIQPMRPLLRTNTGSRFRVSRQSRNERPHRCVFARNHRVFPIFSRGFRPTVLPFPSCNALRDAFPSRFRPPSPFSFDVSRCYSTRFCLTLDSRIDGSDLG